MKTSNSLLDDLKSPYPLQPGHQKIFREQGRVHLPGVFRAETLVYFREVISRAVAKYASPSIPLEKRTTYDKAFLQVMNLWRRDSKVKLFAFSRKLARLAAELMGVSGIRLYHDQALYKEPGGGLTPWHADQYYWPLESDTTCTVWVPLQDTPLEMGPIAFAAGSHHHNFGRDLNIGDDSEEILRAALAKAGFPHVESRFRLGDVSFHGGWTFHHAGPNRTARMRAAMTVIYMEDGIRMIAPRNVHQEQDWERWLPGARVGEPIDSPVNPVLYRSKRANRPFPEVP